MDGDAQAETTAFVREVLLPGGPSHQPRIEPSACAFRLRVGDSVIHRWGIHADEDIPARRRVIEVTQLGEHYGARIDELRTRLTEAFERWAGEDVLHRRREP